MKARYLAIVCILIIILTSNQCSRREDQARHDASTVTVFWRGDEWLLGPAEDEDPQMLMFSQLWHYNNKGDMEPDLAERWEHSEDLRTWTYYLRPDARWHDRVPVTAHDFKFSLELFAHPAVLNYANEFWIGMESVTVLDEFTFAITYTRPKVIQNDWAVFYPKHLLENLDPKEFFSWDFWTHPIGNGPYRYVRHVPKMMMELEANPDYYKGKPKIERLVFKLGVGNPLTELLSGNVDMVRNFNKNDIPMLPADGRFRVYQTPGPYYLYPIYWNHRHPLFRDPKVRRAITLAINRRELVQVMNYPDNTPIFDTIFTWHQFKRGEIPEPLPYDPERAKQLLEAAGWYDQDGDGIRERDGEEARFTAIAWDIVAPTYVQAQLLRVGIQMNVRSLAGDAQRVRVRAGEFEAAFGSFANDARNILHDKWFSPDSPIGYSNPQIVKLLQTALSILDDPEAVDGIYRELMPIFREELPMTFLYPAVQTNVAHRRIRGPEGWAGFVNWMDQLWIEEEK